MNLSKIARSAVCIVSCGIVVLGSTAATTGESAAEWAEKTSRCASEPGDYPTWYEGPSASEVYDEMFSDSEIEIPGLDAGFVPQGMDLWEGMLLISAYLPGEEEDDPEQAARVFAVNASTGEYVGSVEIDPSHAGGIAVIDQWVFVQGPKPGGKHTVDKYLASHMMLGLTTPVNRIRPMGEEQLVNASSFLHTDGNRLYTGKHNPDESDFVYEHRVTATGRLVEVGARGIPPRTQGMEVASGMAIYSTSWMRSNFSKIYLENDHPSTDTKCFNAPSMSQGVVAAHGSVFLLTESGAEKFKDDSLNPITTLHKVSLADLLEYAD